MNENKIGRIVWHDLFTVRRTRSISFYEKVAGWRFVTEHAADLAWGGGEQDYVLALSGDEAGAGFAETPEGLAGGWIAYIEVADIDAVAGRVGDLGGTMVRPPFDVAGVGRNCLLRDPLGALVGMSASSHSFPVPRRQFGTEIYLTKAVEFPEEFYADLFGWQISPDTSDHSGSRIRLASGDEIAAQSASDLPFVRGGTWLPQIKIAEPDISIHDSETLEGELAGNLSYGPGQRARVILRDPNGALFVVQQALAEV